MSNVKDEGISECSLSAQYVNNCDSMYHIALIHVNLKCGTWLHATN